MSGPGTTYTISKAPRNIAISAITALSHAFFKAIILEKSGWHVLAIHANPITMIGIFIFLINLFLKSMPKRDLDAYDRRILEALQQNGRLTNVELAEQIGLSPSPCLRRMRMLEEAGVIQGYEARLAPDEVGLGLTVFVGVKRLLPRRGARPGRLPARRRPGTPAAADDRQRRPRSACRRSLPTSAPPSSWAGAGA
ncbi:hypothetical protein G6F59_014600 [Rhizopus arrhizus]|nr:hypothetical protein G6F59_014600 [Rhizopus arrhizus]